MNVASASDLKSTWCCDQGRLFLIFCLLCGPELLPPPAPSTNTTKQRPKSEPAFTINQFEQGSAKDRRRGRRSFLSRGTGYGDELPGPQAKAGSSSRAGDDNAGNLELYFSALSSVLPSVTRNPTTRFDYVHQPAVSAMVSRSPVFQHASVVLRHAAIEELTTRCGPILAVLDLLDAMVGHVNTCPLLLRATTLFPQTEQLIYVVLGDVAVQTSAKTSENETAQSLAAIVEHLAVPCRKFIETSRRVGTVDADVEEGKLLGVVQRICGLADWFGTLRSQLDIAETHAPSEPSVASSSRSTANVTTRSMRAKATAEAERSLLERATKTASEWHRENCVKDVPDDAILKDFYYSQEAIAAETLKPASGRIRKLLAQVSSLSSDLPEGIYVRHGESRLDVMKILITGPAGTPYEHGLFEFDMFCDGEFPQKPPKMFFWTTGGGNAAFNPNLYPNGKSTFCLSHSRESIDRI